MWQVTLTTRWQSFPKHHIFLVGWLTVSCLFQSPSQWVTCPGSVSLEWTMSGLGSVWIIFKNSYLIFSLLFIWLHYYDTPFTLKVFSGGLGHFSDGGSVDPSSDWNAPSEAWGNYEEPTPEPPPAQEQPLPEPAKVNLLIAAAVSTSRLEAKLSIMGVTWTC